MEAPQGLPGLKGGPVAWGARIGGILGGSPLDFRRSLVDPCLWTHSTTGVRIGRHMDDFIMTGPFDAVQTARAKLKVTGVLDQCGKQTRFLGSFITRVRGGYTIQTDTEILLAGLRDLNFGVLQAVETAWCHSSDSRSHAAGTDRAQAVSPCGWPIPVLQYSSRRLCIHTQSAVPSRSVPDSE